MIGWILLILTVFVVFIFINIAASILLAYYNRKCPYCGKRMKLQYTRRDKNGDIECYVFHCPHCGAFENVTPIEMVREHQI